VLFPAPCPLSAFTFPRTAELRAAANSSCFTPVYPCVWNSN